MKKLLLFVTALLFFSCASAATQDLSPYFYGQNACFILYDVNHHKLAARYNPRRCAERVPPNSTFKVPLSLMAFDQKIITPQTVFKWDGQDKGFPAHNQDQTPKTWLQNSVVWVSQELTPRLGLEKIKHYLAKMNYGNQDFSGDPGQNNGLTHAWLNSSLKISANEQLAFMQALLSNRLPVSQYALAQTKANMFIETLPGSWKLYGKTGSANHQKNIVQQATGQNYLQDGLFIGYLVKGKQKYIVVLNFTDLTPPKTSEWGGPRAKEIAKQIIKDLGKI